MSQEGGTKIRRKVSRAYSEALRKSSGIPGNSCGGSAARLIDYGKDSSELPESAVQNSFGCGNPLAFAGVREGQVVLDLGSGAGLDLLVAARAVGESGRVIGIDMNDDMIAAARANIEKSDRTNVEVRKGIIEELPVEDASVDWVISNCVINLSPQKELVFKEIARVLKPGGHFSISDIIAENLPETLRRDAVAYSACIGGAISEREYVAGLAAAGLEGVRVDEERVYSVEELCGIVQSDLDIMGVPNGLLDKQLEAAEGKVRSARIVGHRPSA